MLGGAGLHPPVWRGMRTHVVRVFAEPFLVLCMMDGDEVLVD